MSVTAKYNYGAKLAIKLTKQDGSTELITPLESFEPNIETPHTEVDSTEEERIGWEHQPTRFTFNIGVKAIGSAVKELTRVQLAREDFQIGIAEQGETGDWTFKSLLYTHCRVLSASLGTIQPNGAPVANFRCGALLSNIDDLPQYS